ncbi:hypothetical protein KQI84_03525 [bacterium]|nr:hypothetical protein [bacterium]
MKHVSFHRPDLLDGLNVCLILVCLLPVALILQFLPDLGASAIFSLVCWHAGLLVALAFSSFRLRLDRAGGTV